MANKIAVITMVKNEADIIESFARHALSYADVLLVTDHSSTDETRKILELLQAEGLPIRIDTFTENGYFQSEVMTRLLYRAVEEENADIIVAADADEFLVLDDSEGGAEELRSVLQSLDATKWYSIPWVNYELQDSESGQEQFLLSRPCRRSAEPDPMRKTLVGGHAARKYPLQFTVGNHGVYTPDTKTTDALMTTILQGLHVAHFKWRSRVQRLSKALCGWPTIIAAFSSYTYNGGHWQNMFKNYLATGAIPGEALEQPVPADLGGYVGCYGKAAAPERKGAALCYTKTKTDCLPDVARLAESFANSYVRERLLASRKTVSVLLVYNGDEQALSVSLRGIAAQTYPYFELLLLDFTGASSPVLPRAVTEWEREHPQTVKILSGSIFERLRDAAHGEYIQWVLPGDELAPDKLFSLLLLMVNCGKKCPMAFSSAAVPETGFFPPYFVLARQDVDSTGFRDAKALPTNLLKNGMVVEGGLSCALFQRYAMECADWLAPCFAGDRLMELSVWTSLGELLPQDESVAVLFLFQLGATVSRCWTADDYVLHEIEWRYLLDRYRGTELLTEEDFQAALATFSSERQKRAEILRSYVTPELHAAYMEA